MTTADTRAAVVMALRAQIAAAERGRRGCSRAPTVPFGIPTIDRHLPTGGLLLGAVHELQASGPDVEVGAAPALFVAGVPARRPGPVVWIGRSGGVFAHGLLQAGPDPRRIVFVDAGKAVLLAMEEAPRHPDIAGVVCELEGRLDLVMSRRLQLAAEGSRVLGLPDPPEPAVQRPSPRPAVRRHDPWRIGTMPSPPALPHAPQCPACTGHCGGSSCCAAAAVRPHPGSWTAPMRRVVSLRLPFWPIDRLRQHGTAVARRAPPGTAAGRAGERGRSGPRRRGDAAGAAAGRAAELRAADERLSG